MTNKVAFEFKDEKRHIDSLVFAEYSNDRLVIRTGQKVGSLKYFITAYVISACGNNMGCPMKGDTLTFVDGSKELHRSQVRMMSERASNRPLTVTIDSIISYFTTACEKQTPYAEHSPLSSEYIPDFSTMKDDDFKKWTDYFFHDTPNA